MTSRIASGQNPNENGPNASSETPEERLRKAEREKELYRGLLDLSDAEAPMDFVERALTLIVDIVGAERAYLELMEPENELSKSAWSTAAGCSDEEVARIRETVSRGIIAHAVAMGQVVSVPSALLDPRFRDRASVKRSKIEAVLCVPIGRDPPLGVVYLQGRDKSGPFSPEDVGRTETFARHLVPLAEQFFRRHRQRDSDATRLVRQRLRIDSIVGRSAALAQLFKEVEQAAPVDISLLITGETGTGKSQLARVIHQNSRRRQGPFMEINCAAIPESLVESELFGAVAGAHSTATGKLAGKVSAAHGGTLFLDEVAELSLTAQAKLLQLLQTREYYPLGSVKAQRADIRIIAATNADLLARIKEQRFREDLYYRLSVLPLRMPAIAEREEDIQLLAEHFCEQAAARHGVTNVRLSPSSLSMLQARSWPGNVRELANAVEAGVIRAMVEAAEQVQPNHLFPGSKEPEEPKTRGTFQEETRRFQCRLLQQALDESDWNVAQTARHLDLTRAHVYNLIRAFGLSRNNAGARLRDA